MKAFHMLVICLILTENTGCNKNCYKSVATNYFGQSIGQEGKAKDSTPRLILLIWSFDETENISL